MADDRDGSPAFVECRWFVVFGNERSAENRLDTEHREEPGRHACAGHGLRFRSVATEVGVPGPVGRGAREEIGLLRPIGEIEIRNVAVGNARRRIFSFEVDDAFGIWKRKWPEENAIDQTKDRGVCTDPQTESEHSNRGESLVLKKHPESI